MPITTPMSGSITQALRGTGGNEPSLMSRVLGVLLLCGGALTLLAVQVSAPADWDVTGLYGIVGGALAAGCATIVWADRARAWMVHALFAAGTGLICLGIYFAGVATGAYAVMFVWLVVVGASFFSTRAITAHVAWILLTSAVAIGTVEEASGISALTRWTFGSLLLLVAAAVMSQIVAGRRSTEERLRKEIGEKEQLQRELEHLAHHDPLTGLPNRRSLEQAFDRELARAGRQGTPLCVVALDLDELKAYNDTHGHAAGDRLLKHAAGTFAAGRRATDLIARMGGDEFVALLPGCNSAAAANVVQRLRRSYPPGHSFSAGIACWDRRESADELMNRADAAMYRAKTDARSSVPAGG